MTICCGFCHEGIVRGSRRGGSRRAHCFRVSLVTVRLFFVPGCDLFRNQATKEARGAEKKVGRRGKAKIDSSFLSWLGGLVVRAISVGLPKKRRAKTKQKISQIERLKSVAATSISTAVWFRYFAGRVRRGITVVVDAVCYFLLTGKGCFRCCFLWRPVRRV